jgi:hypothetical protein
MLPCPLRARSKKEYKTKDGSRVLILPIGKVSGHDDSETRIEFYSPQNQMLCALDYSSEDGEHGFGVVKAEWTPDEKYFVFSLASSGGHQPWQTPKFIYSVGTREIRSLDRLTQAAQFANGDFGLEAPNTVVLTEITLDVQPKPVKLALDKLLDKHRSQPALRCSDGQTFDAGAVTRGTK